VRIPIHRSVGVKRVLTSWNSVLVEQLIFAQLVKKVSTFYETRRFIIVFTRARHWSRSWARWIHSTTSRCNTCLAPVISLDLITLRILNAHHDGMTHCKCGWTKRPPSWPWR